MHKKLNSCWTVSRCVYNGFESHHYRHQHDQYLENKITYAYVRISYTAFFYGSCAHTSRNGHRQEHKTYKRSDSNFMWIFPYFIHLNHLNGFFSAPEFSFAMNIFGYALIGKNDSIIHVCYIYYTYIIFLSLFVSLPPSLCLYLSLCVCYANHLIMRALIIRKRASDWKY